jgi:hypothetical protein
VFPADSAWNRDVSADQVDPHSADYLAFMGAGSLNLHPDFGAPEYGQPFAVVSGSQERVPMSFLYASQSEPGPYPFPRDVPIQPDGDRHVVVLERDHCVLYETYNTYSSGAGFYADSGAVFDLRGGAPRPDGWSSATAAGLPILPGLRATTRWWSRARFATRSRSSPAPPHTGTLRRRRTRRERATRHTRPRPGCACGRTPASIYRYHGASLTVLRGLQRYGMFVTDNAAGLPFWVLKGTQDPRWPTRDLEQLKSIPASAFEVVKLGPVVRGL